jgi:Ser/Thr protein kinase RdoA (MazF antagonist)
MRRIAASAIGGPATGHREGQSETARGRSFEARSGAACEPDVGDGGLEQALELCYRRVTEGIRSLPEVIVHGDYGAHQIIVDRSGDWHLVDYEFAVRGPFADDVGGCEARLLRRGIRDRECFLRGYAKVAGSVEGYAAFRAAFMAYNLLAMLTYGSSATPRDWSLLQELLGKRETE